MPALDNGSTQRRPYDAVRLAKKHRISLDEAKAIIKEYGADLKGADKAARRIAT